MVREWSISYAAAAAIAPVRPFRFATAFDVEMHGVCHVHDVELLKCVDDRSCSSKTLLVFLESFHVEWG